MKNNSLTEEQSPRTQTVLIGSGISMSAAIGNAHVIKSGLGKIPRYHVADTDIPDELKRFRKAVAKAQKQIARLKAKTSSLTEATAEELELLLDAHAAMLVSTRMLSGIEKNIAELNVNAEAALEMIVEEIAMGFEKVKDAYLAARVQDIKDVGSRILRQLMETPYQVYSKIPKGSIIVAQELSPADTALMDPASIAGIITEQGGSDGHTAIMARSLNIPAVLGNTKILAKICDGDTMNVDLAREDLVSAANKLVGEYPEIGALVLECTNMGPFSKDINLALGLPVYDVISYLTWFHAGLRPQRYRV